MIVSLVVFAWLVALVWAIRFGVARWLPGAAEWVRYRVTRRPQMSAAEQARIVERLKSLASDDGGAS